MRRLPSDAPNVLIIMLDDVGPALPETCGGPIHTPTLSHIANSVISYNSFRNAAMCSPARAALLTGRSRHRTGFGQIAEPANDLDSYSPMSLAYFDRAPFKFNGQIDKVKINYTK